MNPIARVPLAFALVGLMAACAAGPGESSSAPAIPTPISSPSGAPTGSPSVAPDPSDDRDASGATEDVATVEIVGFAFAPAELTVSAGSEVTFTNLDDFSHTATAGTADEPMPALFDSGRLAKGDSFSFVFADAGTVAYYCAVHPSMEGSIAVEE